MGSCVGMFWHTDTRAKPTFSLTIRSPIIIGMGFPTLMVTCPPFSQIKAHELSYNLAFTKYWPKVKRDTNKVSDGLLKFLLTTLSQLLSNTWMLATGADFRPETKRLSFDTQILTLLQSGNVWPKTSTQERRSVARVPGYFING